MTTADVVAAVETIDPTTAETYLGRNSHNRPLRNRHVSALAGAISRGEWAVNGDAIRFADDGSLLDGQHRLWAIIEADAPIETLVIRGLPRTSQETMDAGAKRNLGDALRLRGESNPLVLAAAISYHWRMKNDYVRTASKRPTTQQAIAHLDRVPELRDAVALGYRMNKMLRIPSGMGAALSTAFAEIDGDAADVFWQRLDSGAGLDEGSPILALRRALESSAMIGSGRGGDGRPVGRLSSVMMHALIVKAWNYYRDGAEIERLGWRSTGVNAESFPVAR